MGVDFLGYDLFDRDVSRCADEIAIAAAGGRNCKLFACLNPHSYAIAKTDDSFRTALRSMDWLVPDGTGVVFGARRLGLPITARVTGPDVFLATMDRLNRSKRSVFFLGASDETLAIIRGKVAQKYPGIARVGTYAPPFKSAFSEAENADMIAAINAMKPDVLWVGMTAPKQEKWLAEHHAALEVGAAGAIGAAFDFFAGTVKRSPKLFRATGLEWLPRLLRHPHRLWRRMFVSAPVFLADVRAAKRRQVRARKMSR